MIKFSDFSNACTGVLAQFKMSLFILKEYPHISLMSKIIYFNVVYQENVLVMMDVCVIHRRKEYFKRNFDEDDVQNWSFSFISLLLCGF